MTLKELLIVAAGGAAGSVARYAAGAWILHAYPSSRFPWGTMFVNLVGCFAIGLAAGYSERLTTWNSEFRLALIVGFLGGFTTFSAFGLDTFSLIKNSQAGLAALYSMGTVLIGTLLVQAGLKIAL